MAYVPGDHELREVWPFLLFWDLVHLADLPHRLVRLLRVPTRFRFRLRPFLHGANPMEEALMKTMKELGKKPALEWALYGLGILALIGSGVAIYLFNGLGFLCLLPVLLSILFTYAFFARYGLIKSRMLKRRIGGRIPRPSLLASCF